MATISAAHLAEIRAWIGNESHTDTELETLADLHAAPYALSLQVLRERRADMLDSATDWEAVGDYKEKLEDQLDRLEDDIEKLERKVDEEAAVGTDEESDLTDRVGRVTRDDRERMFGT